ncbi:MAG: hypothetical protein R2748_01020 [Bryobacterales bacterium]
MQPLQCLDFGLVLDGGRIYFEQRRLQAAADAGAVRSRSRAAARRHRPGYLRASTVTDTGLNGYDDSNSTIVVNNPPSSGSYSANNQFAEVTINRVVPTTFMRIMGVESSTVGARSVAGLIPDPFFCIYALDPLMDGAFTNNGNAEFVASCGAMVNSSSDVAFRGLGTNACTNTTYIGITGGDDIDCNDARQTEPDTGIPAVVDPLIRLVEPDVANMAMGTNIRQNINGVSTIVYTPGIHTGNHNISGSDVVLFQPGVHVFNNGLNISGGTVSGTGVTIFLPNPNGNKSLDIGGGATVNLAAPTSGPYKGMLFWSARSAPYRPPHNKIARGNAGSTYSGTFYFPNEHFDWGGTPDSAAANNTWQLIVARTVSVQGGANTSIMNPPPPDQNPILGPVMVE